METTNIAWCNHTGSPWYICTEVDPCCANCYARELSFGRMSKITGGKWGKGVPRVRSVGFWKEVYKWNEKSKAAFAKWDATVKSKCGGSEEAAVFAGLQKPRRARTFPSLCDWLDLDAPLEWLVDYLEVIFKTPYLDHLLLTKRPENFKLQMLDSHNMARGMGRSDLANWIAEWINGYPPENVWFGFTAGTQKTYNERLSIVNKIPAKITWCSAEPLLERIDFRLPQPFLNWVVVGGESGKKRRDCGVDAIVDAAHECIAWNLRVFVKQDCALLSGTQGRIPNDIWARKEFPDA